jgi:hypothetical protein
MDPVCIRQILVRRLGPMVVRSRPLLPKAAIDAASFEYQPLGDLTSH